MGDWRQQYEPAGDWYSVDDVRAVAVRELGGEDQAVVLEWARDVTSPLGLVAAEVLRLGPSQRRVLRRGARADGTRYLVLRLRSQEQLTVLADPGLREGALMELLRGRSRAKRDTESGGSISSSGAVRELIKPASTGLGDWNEEADATGDPAPGSPASGSIVRRGPAPAPPEPALILDMPSVEPPVFDELSEPRSAPSPPEAPAPEPVGLISGVGAMLRRSPWATFAVVAAGVVLGATAGRLALEYMSAEPEEEATPSAAPTELGVLGSAARDAALVDAAPSVVEPPVAEPPAAEPPAAEPSELVLGADLTLTDAAPPDSSPGVPAEGPEPDAGAAGDASILPSRSDASDGGADQQGEPEAIQGSVLVLRDVPEGAEVRIVGAAGTIEIIQSTPSEGTRVRVSLDGHHALEVAPPETDGSSEVDVQLERETRAERLRARRRRELRRQRRRRR